MFKVIGVCAAVLCALFCLQAPPAAAQQNDVDQTLKNIEQLREEINLVNFINGLNLSEEQLKKLIGVAKEFQDNLAELKSKHNAMFQETEKAWQNLKANLLAKGPDLTREVAGQAANLENKLKNLKLVQDQEYETYCKQVCSLLSDAQRNVCSTFKPCLLPPKDQKNPVLVGQGASNDMAMKILRGIREMPQKLFERQRWQIVERQFDRIKKNTRHELTEEEKAAERERVLKLVDRVRTMDDEVFELEKDKLVEELKVKDQAKELHEELRDVLVNRDPEMGEKKIAKYFLEPLMLPILEDRLKNLTNFTAACQVDLDATTPTDRLT
jgi:hypothetical protein